MESRRLAGTGIRPGFGLRQGMPLSPLLSNFVLRSFDRMTMRKKLNMVRWVDDLIFFCSSKRDAEECFKRVSDELRAIKHHLPSPGAQGSKTQIIAPRKPAEFLGLEIAYRERDGQYVARVPSSVVGRICDEIIRSYSLGNALKEKKSFADVCGRLPSLRSAYRGVYSHADNWLDVEAEIKGTCRKVQKGMLEAIFGSAAMQSLTPDHAAFLGIE